MTTVFEDSTLQERAAARGESPSLIEAFGIRRLYGYRTVSLSSEYAATILIAKNGTGKTTLIGALDAFLRLQLSRLRNIEFSEIFCKLRGLQDEIILTHDELMTFLTIPKGGGVFRLATQIGVSGDSLFDFILSDFSTKLREYHYGGSGDIPNKLVTHYGYEPSRAIKACTELYEALFDQSESLRFIRETLTTYLEGFEVVYLPTYRRVELALTDEPDSRRGGRRRRPKFSVASGSLHVGEIQFGLSDISDRLIDINRSIILQSNNGYRKLSENIISDLIKGFDVPDGIVIPKQEDLKLFFARMESSGRDYGPYYPISTPDFDRVYSEHGVPPESRDFLTYFLGKLNEIVETTKAIEGPVNDFVLSCNKYLSSTEPTTDLDYVVDQQRLEPIDNKIMRLDRTNLSVHVESLPKGRPVSLDALSSGEKQMISLLAKLYLYPKRKIVLIDEPELSLSIDWQRGILVDVILAESCEQVVAITHSPFVFDNSLEPFAKSLSLKIENDDQPFFDLDDDIDFHEEMNGEIYSDD
ncbi:AAA family ATPase [Sphingomonas sp. LR55]|uniref:AAA family ATPase n=1 Tax=Sphingomonas sp. LR55 TaxID=3050231 RepID=UPI002FE13C54